MNTTKNTDLFEACWRAYNRKGVKKVAKAQWDKLPDDARQLAAVHIPYYTGSRERVFCKDFERYLRDRVFENPVYDQKGNILFDPEAGAGDDMPAALDGFQG